MTAAAEIRQGWKTLLACMLCVACGTIHVYCLGSLIVPLSELYGWSRAEITSGLLVATAGAVLFGPLVGMLIDRWGVRPVGLAVVTLYACCIAALGNTGPDLSVWFAVWFAISTIQSVVTGGIWLTVAARGFHQARGLAIGITMSGAGITAAAGPYLIAVLLQPLGLSGTMMSLALISWVVSTACILLVMGRRPANVEEVQATRLAEGLSVREAIRARAFWRLALCLFVASGGVALILVHMQPMFVDAGLSIGDAAKIAAIAGPFVVIGRLGVGTLLDRYNGPRIAAVTFAIPAVSAMLLIGYSGSVEMAYVIAALAGLAAGVEADIMAYLTARYFGLRNYATIIALFAGIYGVGFAGLAALGGWVADTTGGYTLLLWPLIAALAAMSLLVLTLGPYREFSDREDAPAG